MFFFFLNDPAPPEISPLPQHDPLPISGCGELPAVEDQALPEVEELLAGDVHRRGERLADRKSTRLNSSHQIISYAVFCLKKKKKKSTIRPRRTKDRTDLRTKEAHQSFH